MRTLPKQKTSALELNFLELNIQLRKKQLFDKQIQLLVLFEKYDKKAIVKWKPQVVVEPLHSLSFCKN